MDKILSLLNDLKNKDPVTRNSATHQLWEIWYQEAGETAEKELQRGVRFISDNHLDEAREVFGNLIKQFPAFAEAHNKLATLLFIEGHYEDAVAACKRTLEINPHHFGAWNGMGMCLYKLARYEEAIKSFAMAGKIQPYADINREYIGRCRGKLN